ncbi:allophanate hydrolase [Methylotenera sp.]|uniref:allophanate hydrolase n=2 Tax=Methylotenera sp. TaxID=2051956 RepID=UPI002728E487|nr:allophanate hydrolase [Methylotenera sp.]MDO9394005.1 allophanate hydrolase [Methylotenera sp.]MDP2071594.1 allophanate hydrolase [Methylotenera sp.]MDP3006684.1 allophanate hydrolase [Methylotenera sp.]MDP3307881.1 allophanate hydrolase [Methylotenera sp.]MDP3817642.1 allophanate hydrolase [Methylotenera sp.]
MNLLISHLRNLYISRALTPTELVKQLDAEIGTEDSHHIWIRRLNLNELLLYTQQLEGKDPANFPLYGIPFAIKDNIDLAGIPTTAGCAEYAYTPTKSATVVQKLIDAGAIPIGKTNLDQFATGLVGTRSPYGACKNSINPEYISGGSSAGSAVSVALGMASFSLGTDTAGSGRVPAAFNNLVGHKPTCGLLSTLGVVPACRTLDCVSIFAKSSDDALLVLQSAQGFDADDAYSRQTPANVMSNLGNHFIFGVPKPEQLAFFGNSETPILFKQAIQKIEKIGGKAIEIDFSPFLETAQLLYEGPWVAERYAAIREFFDSKPEAIFPVTKQIIGNAEKFSAADTYTALYKLKALQRKAEAVWSNVDIIITPTAGTIYTIAEVEDNPIQTNTNLGYYTNFMNLLDLTAVAVPMGFQSNGLGFGVTICAPAFSDDALLNLANRL